MKKINEFTRAMLVLACIITLAFPISCKEGVTSDLTPTETELSDETLTVASAQKWFEEQRSSSRLSADDSKTPRWEFAFEHQLMPKKKIVALPINYYKKGDLMDFKQLWVYVDDANKTNTRIVEYIYEDLLEYKAEKVKNLNPKKFNGMMLIRDWDDNFLGGFKLKEGKIVGAITQWNMKKNNKLDANQLACVSVTNCTYQLAWVPGHPEYGSYFQVLGCTTATVCVMEASTGITTNDAGNATPPAGGGGNNTSNAATNPLDNWTITANPCLALTYQNTLNREIVMLKTTDGKYIILPANGNSPDRSSTYSHYQNRTFTGPSISFTQVGNRMVADVFTYNLAGNWISTESYDIEEHIHTHPCNGPAPNQASEIPFDKQFAGAYPGTNMKFFIANCNGKYQYNTSGNLMDGGVYRREPLNCP